MRCFVLLALASLLPACIPPCDPYAASRQLEPVTLLSVIEASGLPDEVPVVTLSATALDANNGFPAGAEGTLAIRLDGPDADLGVDLGASTGVSCDAAPILDTLIQSGVDLRNTINVLTEAQAFSLSCTGTGGWAGGSVTLRASGVTVPVDSATSFTLALELTVVTGGTTVELFGTQAFGVVDIQTFQPGVC